MVMTDPIADMLTRIRNATRNHSDQVLIPSSKLKVGIADVLKREGFVENYTVHEDGHRVVLEIGLRYGPDGEDIIRHIQRFSKPGCRRYRGAKELPTVLNGLGIAIVSTNKGVMSDRQARKENVGGEVLCTVY
jgi:small subunit ribosomal protein S8